MNEIQQWAQSVIDGTAKELTEVYVTRSASVNLFNVATKQPKAFAQHGKVCRMSGSADFDNVGFSLYCDGKKLHVNIVKKNKPKRHNVAATSRESYASIDVRTQCGEVAAEAIKQTRERGYTTDGHISQALGIPCGTVSARRPLLQNGIRVGEVLYRFESAGVVVGLAGKKVNAWKLTPETAQLNLF